MAELKPCPFCGGEADCNNAGFLKNGKPMWAVECVNCGMVTAFFYTDSEAIEAWNKRTERPNGRWVLVEYRSSLFGVDQEYQCSICGTPSDYEGLTRYCPNCGADMRGESDDRQEA